MIVLTGAGGFIGSVVLGYLNSQGIDDIIVFDDLPTTNQFRNLVGKKYISLHATDEVVLDMANIDCVIHIGANSSTLEKDWSSLYKTNVQSTRYWHDLCRDHNKKFIFTSSAAVYGNGNGPENKYAFSKLVSENDISNGVILRLFNVYGPNEYHKDRMASTIYHWYNQLDFEQQITIFKNSHEYCRDFIWVEDVAKTVHHFINNYKEGLYDLGTGQATSFETIADLCIESFGAGTKKYVNMPSDLEQQYQHYTCANVDYLKEAGVEVDSFLTPAQGIDKYYTEYLKFTRTF